MQEGYDEQQPGTPEDGHDELAEMINSIQVRGDEMDVTELKNALVVCFQEVQQMRDAHNNLALDHQRIIGQLQTLITQQSQIAVAFGRLTSETHVELQQIRQSIKP